MDFLYKILPKDLVFIIEDYAKDRTNYDKVCIELKERIDSMNEIFMNHTTIFGLDVPGLHGGFLLRRLRIEKQARMAKDIKRVRMEKDIVRRDNKKKARMN